MFYKIRINKNKNGITRKSSFGQKNQVKKINKIKDG